MLHKYCLGVLLCVAGSFALYDSSSDVVDLTPSNFDRLVSNSDDIWLVEFYAPWCGHCKNLVPEYKKAAKALKGIVKVGGVDADQHKSLAQTYGVSGFPTIKIFTGSKHTPYQGQRTAEGFVDAVLKAAKEKAYNSLGKKTGGSSDKKGVYGHKIPWNKVSRKWQRSTQKKQIFPPNNLQESKILEMLERHLFRRQFDAKPPKIIRKLHGVVLHNRRTVI